MPPTTTPAPCPICSGVPNLSPEWAAVYLCTTPGVLANKRSQGTGPDYIRDGSKILYRREALDRYLDARTVTTRDSA